MGVLACLLFGIMAAWIARSIHRKSAAGGSLGILVTGVVGGIAGLSGILLGWGDLESFNLFNVFLAILFSAALMLLWSKVQESIYPAETAAEIYEDV